MKSELFDNWDTKTQYQVRVTDWMLVVAIWRQNKRKKVKVQFT